MAKDVIVPEISILPISTKTTNVDKKFKYATYHSIDCNKSQLCSILAERYTGNSEYSNVSSFISYDDNEDEVITYIKSRLGSILDIHEQVLFYSYEDKLIIEII